MLKKKKENEQLINPHDNKNLKVIEKVDYER